MLDTAPRIVSAKTEYMQAINFQNMQFSSLFSFGRKPAKASLAFQGLQTPGATGDHSLPNGPAEQKLAVAVSCLQSSVEPKIDVSITTGFLPKQLGEGGSTINQLMHRFCTVSAPFGETLSIGRTPTRYD